MIIQLPDYDPFLNLATEDWLFRYALSEQPVLLLYVNDPCVVIGRGQNPWRECDVELLEQHNIPLLRRQSGGGTVFHDRGNLNFSFLMPKTLYNKMQHLTVIQQALASLDIAIKINERHDLVAWHNNQWCKLSGSAFRERKDTAFHHGTLLVHSDLHTLRAGLSNTDYTVSGKGVASVKSPVCNLIDLQPSITLPTVIMAITQHFAKHYGLNADPYSFDPSASAQQDIHQKQQEYKSWAWRFGKTLPCTLTHRQGYHAVIEQGYLAKEQTTWPQEIPLPSHIRIR